MKNSNLKKMSRPLLKEIHGGSLGIKKCNDHSECPGGACCQNVCMYNPCFEV